MIQVEQKIVVANSIYKVVIEKKYAGDNGNINYLLHLKSTPSTKIQRWSQRSWDDLFIFVAAPSGYFITLYTKKDDPSKVLLKKFLKSRLSEIQAVRSLPLSGLLFRSLISYPANEIYGGLQRFLSFPIIPPPVSYKKQQIKPLPNGTFEPFLSVNRDLWISYSFTEEKAHRLAFRVAGQAKRLIIVYCHPTFTRHHRCDTESVNVVSLSEYLGLLSPEIHRQYINQTRFLINHMQLEPDEVRRTPDKGNIISNIENQEEIIPIRTSELREAKAGLGILVTSTWHVAYVCACANLINAALNKKIDNYQGSQRLSKEVYSFKSIFARVVDDIILNKPPDVQLYVQQNGPVYIRVGGLQFSFHGIPRTSTISAFEISDQNIPQTWTGLRLQPVAPLVLKWARVKLQEDKLVPL
ncbi:hypothetical protein BVY01_04615 [bacterium I07]|nr:hypothetical protein BVY01_04615 [bacterium I07]